MRGLDKLERIAVSLLPVNHQPMSKQHLVTSDVSGYGPEELADVVSSRWVSAHRAFYVALFSRCNGLEGHELHSFVDSVLDEEVSSIRRHLIGSSGTARSQWLTWLGWSNVVVLASKEVDALSLAVPDAVSY